MTRNPPFYAACGLSYPLEGMMPPGEGNFGDSPKLFESPVSHAYRIVLAEKSAKAILLFFLDFTAFFDNTTHNYVNLTNF